MTQRIFIKSVTGSTFVLNNIDQSWTVLDVKYKLKKQEGISEITSQQLLHGYLEFQNGDNLRHYNITKPCTLMMTVILTDGKSILMTLDADPNDTVETLKQKTANKITNVKKTEMHKFYFAGSMPNDKTLLQCNIADKSTIHLILETDNNEQSKIYDKHFEKETVKRKKAHKNYNSFNDGKKQYLEMINLSKNENDQQHLLPQHNRDTYKDEPDCCSCVIL